MHIRLEAAADIPGIRQVNLIAFGRSTEADIVDALRDQATSLVSLVAEDRDAIIGHILCSPVTLDRCPELALMGLAPMAVLPAHQRQGVGSALVREGIRVCTRLGASALVVVGHPTYYPRFGFVPASRFRLSCEYDVPDDVFMALELSKDALAGQSGRIRYHPAFNRA